jgi:broad specificity phosphatase PhoE
MRHFAFLFLFVCLLPACTTQYYLVRHAEKQDNSSNALLSAAGLARANILRDSLLNKGIDIVFASTFSRTQQTAQPLATAMGLPLNLYRPDTTAGLIAKLKNMSGRNVLVVGHSNNIPEIVQALSGESVSIAENDFDNLFIVKVTKGWGQTKKSLVKTTYGPASP